MPPSSISFGLGCFHFRWHPLGRSAFELSEYETKVVATLESLPAANYVEVTGSHDIGPFNVSGEEPPSLSDGEGAFPSPLNFNLRFELEIPYRVQEELAGDLRASNTGSERFRVIVEHNFFDPVAFVQPVESDSPEPPSSAVVLVRKFLEREFNAPDQDVKFEYLGPSPFHAQFLLEPYDPDGPENPQFVVDLRRPHGYSRLAVAYNIHTFPNLEEAFRRLRMLMRREAGFFYRIKSADTLAYDRWDTIEESLGQVVEGVKERGASNRLLRLVLGGSELQDLRIRLVEFEANMLRTQSYLNEHYQNVYEADEPKFIQSFVDRALEYRPQFPIKPTGSLVQFLGSQRSRTLGWIIALVSAVVGGAVGAGLTLVF